ncbi:MNS1 protein, partial [Polypterus senegalus]
MESLGKNLLSFRSPRTMAALQQQHYVTSRLQENMTRRERNQQFNRDNLLHYLREDKILEASMVCADRVENRRHLRKLNNEYYERNLENAIEMEKNEKEIKRKQLERDELMAKEHIRIENEILKDEKIRQQARENSEEIRELELKLKCAYVFKERAEQMAKAKAIKCEQLKHEAEMAKKMKCEFERETEKAKKQLEKKQFEEMMKYQEGLEVQLEEDEKKRQDQLEEFLKEKMMVDEIVRKIYAEDQEQRRKKLEKMKTAWQDIDDFAQQQAVWRRRELEKMEEENKRIIEFMKLKQHREETRKAQQNERSERKQVLQQQIAQQLKAEQKQREEEEQFILDLCHHEKDEAERQKEIQDMENRIRKRLELKQIFRDQIDFKKLRRQAEKEEEDEYRRQWMANFAEEDRIEQMNAQKRRMKQLEHRRIIENILEERRQRLLTIKEREKEEYKNELKWEADRLQIIEEERHNLLKQHATKLLGFLPSGIFKGKEDLELFDEDFQKNFLKKDPETILHAAGDNK